jgi:hypothetical protein
MKRCWEEIAADSRFAAAATLGSRVGFLELGGGHDKNAGAVQ